MLKQFGVKRKSCIAAHAMGDVHSLHGIRQQKYRLS